MQGFFLVEPGDDIRRERVDLFPGTSILIFMLSSSLTSLQSLSGSIKGPSIAKLLRWTVLIMRWSSSVGQDAAGLLRQLEFLGLGVDELASDILVCRLDQDLAGRGTLAAQGEPGRLPRPSPPWGLRWSSTFVLLGSGGQEPSLLGLTVPADAGATWTKTALDHSLGIDDLGLDLKVGRSFLQALSVRSRRRPGRRASGEFPRPEPRIRSYRRPPPWPRPRR